MLLSEISKTIDIKKILHQKSNKHFNKINSSSKEVDKKTIFIIEASSYQIFYSKYFKTDHAAILNLSADHLEMHGNINKYAKAKLKLIFEQNIFLKKGYDYFVILDLYQFYKFKVNEEKKENICGICMCTFVVLCIFLVYSCIYLGFAQ